MKNSTQDIVVAQDQIPTYPLLESPNTRPDPIDDMLDGINRPLEKYAEFDEYLDLFFKYNLKAPFHVKRSYAEGWIKFRQGKRKDGTLYDRHCWPALVSRHLNNKGWIQDNSFENDGDMRPFWIALRSGKKSALRCIDFDNKHGVLGYYDQSFEGITGKEFKQEPFRPVTVLTLDHMRNVKRLYDAFPDQVWCVSSLTLGLHIWQRFPQPQWLLGIEQITRPKLRSIGLPSVEVHPMPKKVLRRPFGEHYCTITEDGILDDFFWQMWHFLDPKPVSFDAICRSMVELCRRELQRYQQYGILQQAKESPFLIGDFLVKTDRVKAALREIEIWQGKGYPESQPSVFRVIGEERFAPKGQNASSTGTLTLKPVSNSPIDLSDVCNKQWIQTCVDWANNGLPCDDSVNPVAMQLARWFFFVELFDLPKDQRLDRVVELMIAFVAIKNNGFVSRLNAGQHREVEKHIKRTVVSSIKTATGLDLFARIRQKRSDGSYSRVIYLEQVVLGNEETDTCGSAYKCTHKELDDSPLPSPISLQLEQIAKQKKMRRSNGEFPFVRFARRLLNALRANNGAAHIPWTTLQTFLDRPPESKSRSQALKYKKLMAQFGLIHADWELYVKRNVKSCYYRMTKATQHVFEEEFQRENHKCEIERCC